MRILFLLVIILIAATVTTLGFFGLRFQQALPDADRGSQAEYMLTEGTVYAPGVTYPYAVVPTGVHSAEEFTAAQRDPVVKAHYANLRIAGETRISARLMYASYRLRNSIRWTSKPIRIPEGEPVLLTNAGMLVRERCGNLLSFTPRLPWLLPGLEAPVITAMTNADTPPQLAFSVPPADLVPTVPTPVSGTITKTLPPVPAIPLPGVPGYPVMPWMTYAPIAYAPSAAVVVPEPKTMGLFLSGVLLTFVFVQVGRVGR